MNPSDVPIIGIIPETTVYTETTSLKPGTDLLCLSCNTPKGISSCCYGNYKKPLEKETYPWKCDGKLIRAPPSFALKNYSADKICKVNGKLTTQETEADKLWSGPTDWFPFGKDCTASECEGTCECPPPKVVEKIVEKTVTAPGSCTDIKTAKKTIINAIEKKKGEIRQVDKKPPYSSCANIVQQL